MANRINAFEYINDLTTDTISRETALILARATIKALDNADVATNENVNNKAAEVRAEIAEVRAELKQDIAEVRAELKQDIAEVRAEIAEVRADVNEIKQDLNEFKKEISYELKLVEKNLTIKLGLMIAAVGGLLLGLAKLIF